MPLFSLQNPRFFLLQSRFPPTYFTIKSSLHTSQTLPISPPSPSPTSQILQIRKTLFSREKTAVELAHHYLAQIRRSEPQLKSFLYVSEESMLREAAEIDKKIERNEEIGVLAGVFVGVKDNICTADMPSTAGSRILENYRPAYDATAVTKMRESGAIIVGKTNLDEFGMGSSTEGSAYQILENYRPAYDATAVMKMRESGAIILGKTNLDEFGMGSSTEGSAYQVTANPWDLSRVPGGSSGGSAAAVSARQCVVSLGSDTGGSVRQPASFCGIVGLKPTYGRVSRYGLIAYASSLDVIGCFGSSVSDTCILLGTIAGRDKHDATSSNQDVPDFTSQFISKDMLDSKPLKGLRVGVIRETLDEGVDAEVILSIRAAITHLEELGCIVTEVSLPSFSLGLPAYYILASSESSSNLSRYDGVRYGNQCEYEELNSLYGNTRAHGFGPEVKRRILMGTYALSAGYYDAYYKRAQQIRTIVRKSFKSALDENDILISPAAPSAAYKIGEKKDDPLAMYAGDIMTVNVNLAGLPALVLPCGFVEGGPAGLPVGFQMIGAAFDEAKLLKVGHIFEQTLPDCHFVPPIAADV